MIFNAKVKTLTQLNDKIFELTLIHDNDLFYFNAGQYIWIETKYGRRAFSIASSSKNPNELKILFKSGVDNSYMNYLSILKIGDVVKIIGPRGVMRVPDLDSENVYVAGGVGITPFLSIIRSLKDSNQLRDITLVSVNRSEEQQIYKNELVALSKLNSNFKYITVIGKITESDLLKIKKNKPNANWYIIGSQGFVDAVNNILVSLKIDINKVNFEENFPSAFNLDTKANKDSFFKKITDQSAIHVVVTNTNGVVLYANKAAEKMTGYAEDQMLGNTPRLWGGLMDKDIYVKFWETIKKERKVFIGELRNIRANGEEYDVLATVSPIIEDGQLVGFLGMEQDITDEKKNRIELKKIRDLMIDRVIEKDKKL